MTILAGNGQLIELLGVLSVVTFVGSLVVVPWLILRMKPDFFVKHRQDVITRHKRHPLLAIFIFCLRNTAGLILFIAGVVMLILPGQGILTMLIGFSFLDFPGKNRLLDKIIKNKGVQRSLNWIRTKGGGVDFIFE